MLKFPQFLAQLERRPRAAYVLAGSEGLLRSEAEAAIVRAVFGGQEPGAGFVPIDCLREGGAAVEPAAILDELRSRSLFSERKVVAARRADAVVKQHQDAFADYLADPDPDSVLVLHIVNWDKRSATARKLDAFAVDCAAPYETSFGEA
ncbi:MAG: DNA polymerase III subunit delta, partial [Planctomycetota bacterium]